MRPRRSTDQLDPTANSQVGPNSVGRERNGMLSGGKRQAGSVCKGQSGDTGLGPQAGRRNGEALVEGYCLKTEETDRLERIVDRHAVVDQARTYLDEIYGTYRCVIDMGLHDIRARLAAKQGHDR